MCLLPKSWSTNLCVCVFQQHWIDGICYVVPFKAADVLNRLSVTLYSSVNNTEAHGYVPRKPIILQNISRLYFRVPWQVYTQLDAFQGYLRVSWRSWNMNSGRWFIWLILDLKFLGYSEKYTETVTASVPPIRSSGTFKNWANDLS